jgi:hypothetical protein
MNRALLGLVAAASLLAAACMPERVAAPLPLCAEPATASFVTVAQARRDAVVENIAVPGCPPAAADAPPIRFDGGEMIALCRDLVVDPTIDAATRRRLADDFVEARAHVARQLGKREAPDPLVVVCAADACSAHFAGVANRSVVLAPGQRLAGARFKAPRLAIVLVVADAQARGTLAHELTHLETRARLGRGQVPAWFDEGLAVVIGGEPRCTGKEPRGIDDLRRLAHADAWSEYTNVPGTLIPTYCQAHAEVDAWVRAHGKDKALDLLAQVRDGARFEDVYGAMRTQPDGPLPTVLVSRAATLGDAAQPFSLVLWMKPKAPAGVVAHVASTEVGTGWCTPFLGYDDQGHLVAQLLLESKSAPGVFAVARDPRPRAPGRWMHVAMTWTPGAPLRLYVDGALAAEAAAPRYAAARAPVFVAWGSRNIGGNLCWPGATAGGAFDGAVTETRVLGAALTAAEIAALAKRAP